MFLKYFSVAILVVKFCLATFFHNHIDYALASFSSRNNVISENISSSMQLQYMEDKFLNTLQLIQKLGYPAEEHKVLTNDGYILTLFRIPYGKKSKQTLRKKPVVLIQHGFVCSSIDWLMNDEEKALPYILADAGYDVFLGNLRGNSYSKEHVLYTTENPEFWKFSWHEMGVYDVPAQIDYILNITKQPNLYYVGHSMGNNVLFVALSTLPEYNSKIIMHFALAPAAFVDKRGNPLKLLSTLAFSEKLALDTLGHNELVITSVLSQLKRFGPTSTCEKQANKLRACLTALHLIAGINEDHLNITWLSVIATHYPNSASSRTFIHFLQLINSRRFQNYDHGVFANNAIYGQRIPPEYDLSNVVVPVVLMWAKDDDLILPSDVAKLAQRLPNVIYNHRVQARSFNHVGFLYGVYARELVYDLIIQVMRAYKN